jgi:hypothetical protein
LMPQCAGIKRNGQRCTTTVEPPQTYCWWHDPKNAEERRRAASKGGKAKAAPVVNELHQLLESLTDRVIRAELPTAVGAVANQLINTRIRLLEYERRLREMEDLEERLEVLEQDQQERLGQRRR